jgi:hypothetical protein
MSQIGRQPSLDYQSVVSGSIEQDFGSQNLGKSDGPALEQRPKCDTRPNPTKPVENFAAAFAGSPNTFLDKESHFALRRRRSLFTPPPERGSHDAGTRQQE